MRLPIQCKIVLSHEENALLQIYADRIGLPKASAAKDILMAVLRDDMIAHGEAPPKDISQDAEQDMKEAVE